MAGVFVFTRITFADTIVVKDRITFAMKEATCPNLLRALDLHPLPIPAAFATQMAHHPVEFPTALPSPITKFYQLQKAPSFAPFIRVHAGVLRKSLRT